MITSMVAGFCSALLEPAAVSGTDRKARKRTKTVEDRKIMNNE